MLTFLPPLQNDASIGVEIQIVPPLPGASV